MTPQTTSFFFLILCFCTIFAYGAWLLVGPGRYTAWERILYAPVYALARVLWRVEIEWQGDLGVASARGASNFRTCLLVDRMQGGAVLVANHRCSVDPFFVQLISGRRVHWMVAGEYFKHALFGPILRSYRAIPTNRGGVDTASTKKAIALARSGQFVGMFPEGRINRTENPLLTIRPGAAIVALRAGVPLVPIWIDGAPKGWAVYSALFMAARVRIIVGNPERIPSNVQDTVEPTNTENERSKSDISRGDAVAWLSQVMVKSMRMGGYEKDDVEIAGKKWLDS
jgi:1-acyl-sn-glycerol-3-phosphate acyltransferase